MGAFKRKGRKIRSAKVPTQRGDWVERTTGSKDPVVGRAIQRMVSDLGPQGRQAWDILERITATKATLTLGELHKRWTATPARVDPDTGNPIEPSTDERLKHVRASFQEGDLRKLLAKWHEILTGPAADISADTAAHYRAAVRDYFAFALGLDEDDGATPVPIALLVEPKLREWVEEMDDVATATVRKRGMGMRQFVAWLRGRRAIGFDPMREVTLPAAGDPLCHYLETADAIRLSDAQPGQYRLFAALLPGSAIEVSTALTVRVRAVSKDTKQIQAPGTKTYNRDRMVRVAEWAWPAVLELLKGKHPDSLLFDQIPDRWIARDEHVKAIAALVEKGHQIFVTPKPYTMRDHRHTWAVRAARSGWPIHAISRQLGHVNGVLAMKVYGRFSPNQEELDRWESMATARDATLKTQEDGK